MITPTFTIVSQPERHSQVRITPDFVVQSSKPLPNRWRCFWYWALLGWKWEAL